MSQSFEYSSSLVPSHPNTSSLNEYIIWLYSELYHTLVVKTIQIKATMRYFHPFDCQKNTIMMTSFPGEDVGK